MSKKSGFTFIELIVVVAVIGIALPALFTIVFGVMRAQLKVLRLSEVKRQGDFALSTMSTNIKNYAISVHSAVTPAPVNQICITPGISPTPAVYFRDKYNNSYWFGYSLQNGRIASASANPAIPTPGYITSSKVTVTDLSIKCVRSGGYALPNISIGFTVSYAGTNTRTEETATLYYQTSVKLRNQ